MDDGSDCMTICCSTFMAALEGTPAVATPAAAAASDIPPPQQMEFSGAAPEKPKTLGDLFKKAEESKEESKSWKIGDVFAPPAGSEPIEAEEEVTCDCSFVIQGGCHSSPTGDGSPCGVKCCAPADEQVKKGADSFSKALGNAKENIKNAIMGIKIPDVKAPKLPEMNAPKLPAMPAMPAAATPADEPAPAPELSEVPKGQNTQGGTPLPGSAIKIEIPVWR